MKGCTLSVEQVTALLRPEAVIAAAGVDARRRGRAWRLRTCPGCGAKPSRMGAAIYRRKSDGAWRWTHHGHQGCAGDLLDLLALREGIDRRTELPKLLELAAKVAGIVASDPDLDRRIAAQIAADRAQLEREEADRAAALAAMPGAWDALDRRSLIGERYLASRSIDPAALRLQGDIVRFTNDGEVAVALRSLETGTIVGIQYRTPFGKGFRSAEYSAPEESALVGRLAELDREGVDVAVVVEGLADTLAARLAFPGCAVFGAAGASHLENVAGAVAERVHEIGGWMLMTVDDDETGVRNAADGINAARDAGLTIERDLYLVDHPHHDLADAWAAGWRWTWPERGRSA